jgi:dipeptidyl aminopeptidase/acylaminoacyl peptidase
MRPRHLSLLLALAVAALPRAALADGPAAAKRPLAVEDLYLLDTPTSPVLSPGGKRVVYARKWIDRADRREHFSLWVAEGPGKAHPLEEGEPDGRAPVFSPDGKWIAFLSTRPRPKGWKQIPPTPPESDTATDVWLLPAAGGKAVPLAGPDKSYGRVFNDGFYGRVAFSPDGRQLAFVADDGKDPRTPEEIKADVRVVRLDGGEGYTGYGPAHIWVANLKASPGPWAAWRVERVSPDDFWYGDPQWFPDGKRLVAHANRTSDQGAVRWTINRNYDLWAIDLGTGNGPRGRLTENPGPDVCPRLSPDGKRLAYLSVPRRGSHRDVLNLVVSAVGSRPHVLFDYHRPDAGKPPYPAPTFPLPDDFWDGNDHILYDADVGTRTRTVRVNLRTNKTTVLGPALRGKLDPKTGAGRRLRRQLLTPPGNTFLKDRPLGKTRLVTWHNEGLRLEGLLTVPPASVAKPPYKLLLHPHGGPHSRSARGFNFVAQVFAAHGYAVFEPNYRGSHGYGQKFIDADRFDFGGGDVRDILSGIDHLVKKGLVDRDRQFVYGSSYGGFLTCWLVGHTRQFRAAVAQNAVTDMTVMWGTSDIRNWVEWEVGNPWKNPAALREHSPLTYADKVRTPTLVLHSRDDRRVPLANGLLFYHALKERGVPTQMVVYPGEGHVIRQPRHREDVIRRVLAWFARHDKD